MYRPDSLLRRCAGVMSIAAIAVSSYAPMYAAEKPKSKPAEAPVPSYYGPQPATEKIDLNMYAKIREEGLSRSHVMELSYALMDGIGPRLTGSPNMKKANEWTRDTLKGFGLENAHLEDWGEFGMGWQQINSWARMISPDPEPVWVQAAPWSVATQGAVSGDLINVDVSSEADLAKYKGKLAGKVVLFGSPRPVGDITEPLFSRYTEAELKEMEGPREERPRMALPNNMTREQYIAERMKALRVRQEAVKMMADEGVKAILLETRDGGKNGGTGLIFDDNTMNLGRSAQKKENQLTVPYGVIMAESYGRLYRLLKAHVPVQMEVNLETKFTGDHEHGFNTIAEIPGTDPALKDEVVMVGGHLDSWIAGTGATDNGAGSVVSMEAVRILKALGVQPRRTIRIALWSGEEQGIYGSAGYVKQHFGQFEDKPGGDPAMAFMRGHDGPLKTTPEWEKLDAYYNLDNGTGRIRGIYTQGNYAIGPIFKQWLAPLADLGASTVTYRDTGGTDHLSFDAVGLPGFQFIQDEMDYETRTHHSNMDTVEHLHPSDLMQAATIEAIFLYNTAQRDAMMPRKPFPTPEKDNQRRMPLKNIFPGAVDPESK